MNNNNTIFLLSGNKGESINFIPENEGMKKSQELKVNVSGRNYQVICRNDALKDRINALAERKFDNFHEIAHELNIENPIVDEAEPQLSPREELRTTSGKSTTPIKATKATSPNEIIDLYEEHIERKLNENERKLISDLLTMNPVQEHYNKMNMLMGLKGPNKT